MQKGLMATLRAGTDTFIWQPWFSRVGANVNFTTASSNGDGSGTRSVGVSGNAHLNLLPMSRFPFEAHINRTNNRTSSDLAMPLDYVSQQVGFSQRYGYGNGEAQFGFDRSTQHAERTGSDRQDTVQASFSHNLKDQRFQLQGNGSNSTRDDTGEHARQENLTLQHSYSPSEVFTLDSMANVSNSDYFLGQTHSDSRMSQLSTQGFWRPEESPLMLSGGARVLAATSSVSGSAYAGNSQGAHVRAANANLGAGYAVSQSVHLNAAANINVSEAADQRIISSNQSFGASYQPAARRFGEYLYSWSVSGTLSNQSGNGLHGHQIQTQFGQNITRTFRIDDNASVSMDANQSIAVIRNSAASSGDLSPTKMITHSAGVSWSRSKEAASTMARVSASDSRGLDGSKEYFQMLNLQLSSNLQTGGNSSWNGSFTVQGTRQGASDTAVSYTAADGSLIMIRANTRPNTSTTTSSGSLSYQHNRLFGVRNLRLVSDLRMNSMALLPVLGSPKDQETAAWENRLTYSIGRTQLRVNTIIARTAVPTYSRNPDGTEKTSGLARVNKAIMFSLARSFGSY